MTGMYCTQSLWSSRTALTAVFVIRFACFRTFVMSYFSFVICYLKEMANEIWQITSDKSLAVTSAADEEAA